MFFPNTEVVNMFTNKKLKNLVYVTCKFSLESIFDSVTQQELIISKITRFFFRSKAFHGIFRSGNLLNLGCSPDTEPSKFSCF